MDHAINSPDNVNNVVDIINYTDKYHLKEQMTPLGKLAGNDTSKNVMFPSVSKYFPIKFAEQCLHIITNNDRLKGLKGSTKTKKR